MPPSATDESKGYSSEALSSGYRNEGEAAQHFGRIRHELRRSGRVMSVVDVQLAAIAFALGNCTVITKDGDVSAVPGLQVENWATA
jgi:predicted nucleic acid-binding protein